MENNPEIPEAVEAVIETLEDIEDIEKRECLQEWIEKELNIKISLKF